jgi:hypothetical protein
MNKLLCQMIADACEREVISGSVEVAVPEDVILQAVAAG